MKTLTREQTDKLDYQRAAETFRKAGQTGVINPNDQPYLVAMLLCRFMKDMPCTQYETKILDDVIGLVMQIGARIDDPALVELARRSHDYQ